MKTTVTINPRYLRAAVKLAAEQDIRYYLNGVLVEITEAGTRYVATNGHALVVIRDSAVGVPCNIIVPRETIAMFAEQQIDARKGVALTYDPDTPRAECRIGDVMFTPIDGKYPDYRKVIPKKTTKEWAQFQVKYMLAFHEAAQIAFDDNGGKLVEFWPNGKEGVCLVTCGRDEFTGSVMPIREDGSPEFAQWVQKPEAVAA